MRIPVQLILLVVTAFLPSSEAGKFTSYIGCFSSSALTTSDNPSSLIPRVAGNKIEGLIADKCALTAATKSPYIFLYPDANSKSVVACGSGCGFFNSSVVTKVDDSLCKHLTGEESEACGGRYSGSKVYVAAYKNTKFSTMSSYTVPQSVTDRCFTDSQFCGSESVSCGASGVCSASKQCQFPAGTTNTTASQNYTSTLAVRGKTCPSGKICASGNCVNENCVSTTFIGCYWAPSTAWAKSIGPGKTISMGTSFCGYYPHFSLFNAVNGIACGCGIFQKGVRVADSKCNLMVTSSLITNTGPSGSSDLTNGTYFSVYDNKGGYSDNTNNDCFYTDPNNCGAPGIKCSTGGVCTNGTCSAGNTIQPPPTPPCVYTMTASGKCLNTQGDAKNCGSENFTCALNYSCVEGQCTDTEKSSASCAKNNAFFVQPPKPCPDSKPNCVDGTCTNFKTDPKNCGGFNTTCVKPFFDCVNGVCTNSATDPDNCMGKKCDPGYGCMNGVCVDRSTNEYTPTVCDTWDECGSDYTQECRKGQCVNPTIHPHYCGIGGVMCRGPNARCIKGVCFNIVPIPLPTFNSSSNDVKNCGYPGLECPATSKCIQGLCVDVNRNPNACGAGSSQVVCPALQFCVNGTCVSTDPKYCAGCSTSFICAQKSNCTNPATDDRNCGKENNVCPPGTKCSGGSCVDLMKDPHHCGSMVKACPIGLTCANGNCTDLNTNRDHCGRIGNTCKEKETCSNGFCHNILIDRDNCGGHGNACDANEKCDAGTCVCVSPFTKLPGSLKCTDPNAPVVCTIFPDGSPQVCAPPLICINSGCYDTTSSEKYCGPDKLTCAVGEFCENGTCVQSNSVTSCGKKDETPKQDCTSLKMNACVAGECVDTNTDWDHCGAINKPCSTAEEVCKGGKCYDSNTSNEYCGLVGMKCGQNSQCVFGECKCKDNPTGFWKMKHDYTNKNSTCINVENDMSNCGEPGEPCDLTSRTYPLSKVICDKGHCIDAGMDSENCGGYQKMCSSLKPNCANGSCTNFLTDPDYCGIRKSNITKCDGTRPVCIDGSCYDAYTSTKYCGNSTVVVTCMGDSTKCDQGTCACTNGNAYHPTKGCIDVNGSDNGNCGGLGVQCNDIAAKCNATTSDRCLPKCIKGTCINVKEHANFCGEVTQQVCNNSTPVCANGVCVDLMTNNDHCGDRCKPCGSKKCANGGCVDTTSDKNNCGTIGNSCGAATCVDSKCTCPQLYTFNDQAKTCVNLSTDPKNCGSFDKVCTTTNTPFCTNCIPECSGGNCYNPVLDPNNCGKYGTKCSIPTPNCANKGCVDFQTDDTNCGSAGSSCNGKSCFVGMCTDITADPKRCGTTKDNVVNCSDDNSICTAGVCKCSQNGFEWKEGKCYDFKNDRKNCGVKDNACDETEACSNGRRIPSDCAVVTSKFPTLWPPGTNCCTEPSTKLSDAVVKCENRRVVSIDINPVNLSIGFPDLTQLDKLKNLSLKDIVNGNIGSTICNSTNLLSLTVTGPGVAGFLPSCLKDSILTNLDVGGSMISGKVPSWLCGIQTLTYWNGNGSSLIANDALDLYYKGQQPLYTTSKCCGTKANACKELQPDCLAKKMTCTDFKTDNANCGGEDKLCETTCSNGSCIDTATDNNNCGAVGTVCKDNSKCSSGKCTCDQGKDYINNKCYDLQNDHDNCGAVNVNCGGSAKCSSGKCVCTAGAKFLFSGSECFDTSSHPDHCGVDGPIVNCTATPNKDCANGKCTNYESDDKNCGGLNIVCKSSSNCQKRVCTCATDFSYLNETCINLKNDPQNCGSVGKLCDKLHPDCVQINQIYDTPVCTDVKTDPKACGESRKQCLPSSQTCAGGSCVPNDCAALAATFPSIWPVATDCCTQKVTLPAPGSVVVTCNDASRVVNLNINSVPLNSNNPHKIPDLKELQTLNLVGMNLTWDVAILCSLPNSLKSLVLQSNALSGSMPECTGRFPALETLKISNNNGVSGSVPSFLCSLEKLKIWDGSSTQLTAKGALGLTYNTEGNDQAPVLKNTEKCCGTTANMCLNDPSGPNCIMPGDKPICVNFSSDKNNCGKQGVACTKGDCKGGNCLDFTNDAANCGGRDKTCDADSECNNSNCKCKSSKDLNVWVTVGQRCLDTSSDSTYCGKDSPVKCDTNQKCNAGKCKCSDDSVKNKCVDNPDTGKCTDPSKDATYCGVVGGTFQKCGPNMECLSGTCKCLPGFVTNPGGVCTDSLKDPNYCGSPENPDKGSFATCTPGVGACKSGKCGCSETAGIGHAEAPDGTCRNTLTDATYCGSEKKNCGPYAVCNNGSCQCGSTFVKKIDGSCTDANIDNAFCGANGLKCQTNTTTCAGGICSCLGTFIKPADSDGTKCVNPKLDSKNCGAAGFECGASATCVEGTCNCRPDAPLGSFMASDKKKCVNPASDPAYCGTKDKNEQCGVANPHCVAGKCTNIKTDPNNCGATPDATVACVSPTPSCMDGKCVPKVCVDLANAGIKAWNAGVDCCTTASSLSSVSLTCSDNKLPVSIRITNPPDAFDLSTLCINDWTDITVTNLKLTQGIPECLCSATKLNTLNLSNNKLSGILPSCLAKLPLKDLQVQTNPNLGLGEKLPPWLCSMTSLQNWDATGSAYQANGNLPTVFSPTVSAPMNPILGANGKYCCGGLPNICGGAKPDCDAETRTCFAFGTDSANCGSKGNVCPSGTTCTEGTCQCPAYQKYSPSKPGCVKVQTDPENCGDVGNRCSLFDKPYCVSGKCDNTPNGVTPRCGDGQVYNARTKECIDYQNNPNHCGFFNNKCDTAYCKGGKCHNLDYDIFNCGSVGAKCPQYSKCVKGICQKDTELQDISLCAWCAKSFTDGNYVCKKSKCIASCPAYHVWDSESRKCVDTNSDPKNCGTCRNVCGGSIPVCVRKYCYDLGAEDNCGFVDDDVFGSQCAAGTRCKVGTCATDDD
ncbi:hypothetical protein HDU77_004627 [Chytriomyces hyalinus]|nr:hypothetical protein HDU77_004627 [Chytriomyces hyalinus]